MQDNANTNTVIDLLQDPAIEHIVRVDRIEEHARKAWGISVFLMNHYLDLVAGDEEETTPPAVKTAMLESLVGHIEELRKLNR